VYETFEDLMEGVVPLGDFWVMNKLKSGMSKEDFEKITTKAELLEATLTV